MPGGTLYVPKLYAPLLPGSIYPDKRTPVPAKGRPGMVLVCPKKGDCRKAELLETAVQRGLVVLVARSSTASIGPRPEVDVARTGTLVVSPTSLKVEVPPPSGAGAPPSSRSKRVLFTTLHSTEPLEVPEGAILKVYSPNDKGLLPKEAFRDAVEWLAGELGPPAPGLPENRSQD